MLCLGKHSNVMLRFMVQALQDRYVAAPLEQSLHSAGRHR